ncbi:hypothetical protein A2311_05830, partial [candidate division WOR-1 bacterium RIFOXYB2_FULL_48_7]
MPQQPPCPYFGRCGGCALQNSTYEEQLDQKQAVIDQLFPDAQRIIGSKNQFFYRNRMDYAFGPDFSLGLRDKNRGVINIERCLLMSESSNELFAQLRGYARDKGLAAYRSGIMRHAVLREAKNLKSTVFNILTSSEGELPLLDLWERFSHRVQGVVWSINLSPADRSYGDIKQVCGQDYYEEELAGLRFKIPVQSFFQTNIVGAEQIIATVKEFLEPAATDKIYDLYSGTGSIGLSLANQVKAVVGIEENEPATRLSLDNAALNKINNYSVLVGRAENVLKTHDLQADKVVVDPPRPGIHR